MALRQGIKNLLINWVWLLVWIVLLVLIGAGIGQITKPGIDMWYKTLQRSPLTPPDYIFGIVWTILYAILGTCGWVLWSSPNTNLRCAKIIYVAQLILNWSWAPLFFMYHQIGLSLLFIVGMIFVTILLIIKTYRTATWVSCLCIFYLAWILFAGYLNYYIWYYN